MDNSVKPQSPDPKTERYRRDGEGAVKSRPTGLPVNIVKGIEEVNQG